MGGKRTRRRRPSASAAAARAARAGAQPAVHDIALRRGRNH